MPHLEQEAKLNLGFLLLMFVVPVVVGVIAATYYFNSQHHAVDRCLDAGGSYDYKADRCDFAASHPYPQ